MLLSVYKVDMFLFSVVAVGLVVVKFEAVCIYPNNVVTNTIRISKGSTIGSIFAPRVKIEEMYINSGFRTFTFFQTN